MTAYYNENDPFAARWLENLVRAGHLPSGDVDDRSILDVTFDDLADYDDITRYQQVHFFAGIGGWPLALQLAGWPEDRVIWTGSCPCQPFSQAGRGKAFNDERHLWPVWFNLIRQCQPPIILGEQVASPIALQWLDSVFNDLEGEGYACAAADLCAASVGAPHIRQRLYWVAYAKLPWRWAGAQFGADDHAEVTKRTQGSSGTGNCGEAGGMAIADDKRCPRIGIQLPQRQSCGANTETGGCRTVVGLGDAGCKRVHGSRSIETREASGGVQGSTRQQWLRPEFGAADEAADRLGNADDARLEGRSISGDSTNERSMVGGVAHPNCKRRQQNARSASGNEAPDGEGKSGSAGDHVVASNGADRTFWTDAEWIYCRDGKHRPVEPGTSPLASGVPARVGKLRAYGNSIVVPLAVEFVKTVMDLL